MCPTMYYMLFHYSDHYTSVPTVSSYPCMLWDFPRVVPRGKPLIAAILTEKHFVFISANKCWCSDLGNYAFNSRAPVSFQTHSEVSALVFIFRKERTCEQAQAQAHAWDSRVSGKV